MTTSVVPLALGTDGCDDSTGVVGVSQGVVVDAEGALVDVRTELQSATATQPIGALGRTSARR
jgi:hypothetical protein